jgi:bifunctional DNA-binding transcriptional regulator/antitoxin component of YhaV-PrlF toxin-antitoxin module
MQLGKMLGRGQVTVPRSIRQAADLQPGDVIAFKVIAPGRVELRALPRVRLADLLARYHIDEPIDEERIREEWQDAAAREIMGG